MEIGEEDQEEGERYMEKRIRKGVKGTWRRVSRGGLKVHGEKYKYKYK